MTSGFLYLAVGPSCLQEAITSATSLRRCDPAARICLVTDQSLQADRLFDLVLSPQACDVQRGEERYAKADRWSWYRKIHVWAASPFDKTVCLDSDTYITEPLTELFDLLDHFDALVTPDCVMSNYAFELNAAPFNMIPQAFGCFNTGVFAFRRSAEMTQFFERYWQNFRDHVQQHTVNDQPALRLTLYESRIRFLVLSSIYNCISWKPFSVPGWGGVVVLHGRNPWLQRWAKHFSSQLPVVVGFPSWRLTSLHFMARFLYWLQRKLGWPRCRP
jgi:hypothetical protein